MASTFRSFVSIDLSMELADAIAKMAAELRVLLAGTPLRWVEVGNIHLTLKFLGEISADRLAPLKNVLNNSAEKVEAFDLRVSAIGIFPNERRPRVIWIGVESNPALSDLVSEIESGAAKIDFPSHGKKFQPHLTLARVRREARPSELARISQLLQRSAPALAGSMRVEEIHLYRSDLSAAGARYSRIQTARLKQSTQIE